MDDRGDSSAGTLTRRCISVIEAICSVLMEGRHGHRWTCAEEPREFLVRQAGPFANAVVAQMGTGVAVSGRSGRAGDRGAAVDGSDPSLFRGHSRAEAAARPAGHVEILGTQPDLRLG